MTDWITQFLDWGGYPAVYALLLFETMCPPMPSEVILPLVGLQVARGELSLTGVTIVATMGAMTGNMLWYGIARWIGAERMRHFVERHGRWLTMHIDDVDRVQRMFDRHGAGIVFTARVLPAVRTFISIPAGIARMPIGRYFLWSTVGTAIWSWALAAIGLGIGQSVGVTEALIGQVTAVIVVMILAWYVWRQLTWNRGRS